jgi:hypothetical protein
MTVREQAQKIVERGNGYGVQCADLLEIKNEVRRTAVWREIVKIGAEEDAARA